MNKLWTDFEFCYFWNDLKKYNLFSWIMNSMKRKLKLINKIWILIIWWTTNIHMTYEYNWFWLQSKSVNDSIKKSHWLNVKCKMIDCFITVISSFWISNFYNLKFLNLLTMSWLLNTQTAWKFIKLYNKSITDLWCTIL